MLNNTDWKTSVQDYSNALLGIEVTLSADPVTPDTGFSQLAEITCNLRKNNRTIYLIGNGASASMASHLCADLAKNARIHTQVFSDLSLITALANDLSYADVFSEPLKTCGKEGDLLVAISSSGESANIIKAANIARQLKMTTITFTAFSPANTLRKSGDINFFVNVGSYGAAESCHSMMLHHWMDMVSL